MKKDVVLVSWDQFSQFQSCLLYRGEGIRCNCECVCIEQCNDLLFRSRSGKDHVHRLRPCPEKCHCRRRQIKHGRCLVNLIEEGMECSAVRFVEAVEPSSEIGMSEVFLLTTVPAQNTETERTIPDY